MDHKSIVIALFLLVCGARSEDITTTDGKKYQNVTISRTEPDGLVIETSEGIEKIPFAKLTKAMQEKYGYDPQKASRFSIAVRDAAIHRDAEGAKQQAIEAQKKAIDDKRQADESDRIAAAERANAMSAKAETVTVNVARVLSGGIIGERIILTATATGSARFGGGGGAIVAEENPTGQLIFSKALRERPRASESP